MQIIDTKEEKITMTSPKSKRFEYGMGIVTINGEDRLAMFGGHVENTKLDSVELYNVNTEQWETSSLKLNDAKCKFAYLSLKLGDIETKL